MSTGPQLDSGGTGDSAEATVTNQDGTTFIEISLPDWVLALRPLVQLVQHPQVWLVAAILGISFNEAFVRVRIQGQSPVELIVEDYLFRQLLVPAGAAVFNLGVMLVNAVLGFFELLASVPGRVVAPVVNLFVGIGLILFSLLQALNQMVAAGLEPFGLAAPVVVPALFALEVVIVAYAAWLAIQTVDLLTLGIIDDVIDIGKAATWPFRRLLGVFR